MLTKITLFPQRAKCQGQTEKTSINHFFQNWNVKRQIYDNLGKFKAWSFILVVHVLTSSIKTHLQVESVLSNQVGEGIDD